MKKSFYTILALATAALTFTACEDVPEPYGMPVVDGSGSGELTTEGAGTLESPYTAADCNALVKAGQTKEDIYVQGVICSIKEVSTSYGNAEYFISADGTEANRFHVFRGYYLNGDKFTSDDQIKVGDLVVLFGNLIVYNGEAELGQGNRIISLNGEGGGSTPDPTPTEGAYIEESFASEFGSFEVKTISGTPWVIDYSTAKATGYDGGTKTTTPSESYLVSKAVDLSASQGATLQFEYILRYVRAGETENKVLVTDSYTGDPATTSWTDITGTLTEGNDWNTFSMYSAQLPEQMIKKSSVVIALYYSCKSSSSTIEVKNLKLLEGKGSDVPTPDPTGKGSTADNPMTAKEAVAAAQGGSTEKVYVEGIVTRNITNADKFSQYGDLTLFISDDGTENDEFELYQLKNTDGGKFSSVDDIKAGDKVVAVGNLAMYNTTAELKNCQLVKLNDQGGGETPDPEPDTTVGGTLVGNVLTVTAPQLGVADKEKLSVVTLTDGTTLTFAGGGNSSVPVYYAAAPGAVRMYPKNSMTINAGSKTIVSVKLVCNNYNNTLYNASGDVTIAGVQATVDGLELVFSGINASQATLTDVSQTTSAPSQLRWEQLVITYAE